MRTQPRRGVVAGTRRLGWHGQNEGCARKLRSSFYAHARFPTGSRGVLATRLLECTSVSRTFASIPTRAHQVLDAALPAPPCGMKLVLTSSPSTSEGHAVAPRMECFSISA